MQGVFEAGLLFLHLGFGGRPDADLDQSVGQLGEAFLELLAVVVARGGLDLAADLLDAGFDLFVVAGAFGDGGVIVVHRDALGHAQIGDGDAFQIDAQILGEHLRAGEDADVLEHLLASVAVAGRLDRTDVQDAAHLVDHEGRQRLALDVLGDDQQGLFLLGDLLQQRHELVDVGDLVFVNQDEGLFLDDLHRFLVGHEVGAEVAAVELHALDDLDLVVDALAFFDGDGGFPPDLRHRVGNDLADDRVVVGADRCHLRDGLVVRHGGGHRRQLRDDLLDGGANPACKRHRVRAGGEVAVAFLEDRLGQHGGGGGSVARVVGGLGGRFLHQLGAHVLILVGEFDFLGHRYAVLGDGRCAPAFVENSTSASGTQRAFDCTREFFHPGQQLFPGLGFECQMFRRHSGGAPFQIEPVAVVCLSIPRAANATPPGRETRRPLYSISNYKQPACRRN